MHLLPGIGPTTNPRYSVMHCMVCCTVEYVTGFAVCFEMFLVILQDVPFFAVMASFGRAVL